LTTFFHFFHVLLVIQFLFTLKLKLSYYTPRRCLWGRGVIASSYSFSTSALDGDECSASRSDRALPPGKGPTVPIVQETGWVPEPVWTQRLEENVHSLLLVQPVARHYTDSMLVLFRIYFK
jgi:hypothetical protein